jgi:hypothetical protein
MRAKNETEAYALDTEGVAQFLDVSSSYLEKLRVYDPENSPPFLRIGRSVRYPVRALIEWAEAKLDGAPRTASQIATPSPAGRPRKR